MRRIGLHLLLAWGAALGPSAAPAAPLRYARQDVELALTAVSDRTVRVTLTPADLKPEDRRLNDSPVLAPRRWPDPVLRVAELSEPRVAELKALRVTLTPAPLTVEVSTSAGRIVQRLTFDEHTGEVTFRLGSGPVLGLGGGGAQFDRRGSFDPMSNGHRAGEYQIFGSRVPIPFLIGTDGWGLFVHRPFRGSFDLRDAEGRFQPRPGGGATTDAPLPLDLFVMHTDPPPAVLAEYVAITGKPVMPPKWALGYMQSHRTLAGPEEVLSVAETFRRKGLPCDALIYLGTGYTPSGWNTGHGSLEFNPQVFDKPADIINRLHDLHFKVVLHKNSAPRTLHGHIPPAAGEAPGRDHIATYWARHQPAMTLGVDGWWPDDGDELPIESRLARHRAYYDGPLVDRPNRRPFSLHRTGYAGMQRCGGWVWSGDTFCLWNTLAAHVPVGINASLSLTPFWGSDTGGFTPTRELTGELYARWFQLSAFTPSFRSHGRAWHTRLPWGWNTGELGPNEVVRGTEGSAAPDSSELHNPEVEPICKRYLTLRYQLLPYTYTAAREAHDTGLPLMRALWLHYPDDPKSVACGDEYLWGRDLLVAPVVQKGVSQRAVYLPPGEWYDYWTNARVVGRQAVPRYVNLATLPLYVRAGAILPLDPPRRYVDEPTDRPMTLKVYPGADGEFVLYEDDGVSLDYQKGIATWTRFRWDDRARTLSIEPHERSAANPGPPRRFEIWVVPGTARRTVGYAGQRVEMKVEARPGRFGGGAAP
jgi:alpha-glucosidase/alpha-D-xyloside xylohydrolase